MRRMEEDVPVRREPMVLANVIVLFQVLAVDEPGHAAAVVHGQILQLGVGYQFFKVVLSSAKFKPQVHSPHLFYPWPESTPGGQL